MLWVDVSVDVFGVDAETVAAGHDIVGGLRRKYDKRELSRR